MSLVSDVALDVTEECGRSHSRHIFESSALSQGGFVSSLSCDNVSPVKTTFFTLPEFLGEKRQGGEASQNVLAPVSPLAVRQMSQSSAETILIGNGAALDVKEWSWRKGNIFIRQPSEEGLALKSESSPVICGAASPSPLLVHSECFPGNSRCLCSEKDLFFSRSPSPVVSHQEPEQEAEQSNNYPLVSSFPSPSSLDGMVLGDIAAPDSPHSLGKSSPLVGPPSPQPLQLPLSKQKRQRQRQRERERCPLQTGPVDVFRPDRNLRRARSGGPPDRASRAPSSLPHPVSFTSALPGTPRAMPMPFIIELSLSSSALISRCLRSGIAAAGTSLRGASIRAVVSSPVNLTLRSDAVPCAENDGWSASASSAAAGQESVLEGKEATGSRMSLIFKLPTFGKSTSGVSGEGGAGEEVNKQIRVTMRFEQEEEEECGGNGEFEIES